MAFLINRNGERVHVDMEVDWFSTTVPLYHEDAELQELWLLNLYKVEGAAGECELQTQVPYTHEPTKDELMHELWKAGLSRFDFVTIEHGWRLNWPSER